VNDLPGDPHLPPGCGPHETDGPRNFWNEREREEDMQINTIEQTAAAVNVELPRTLDTTDAQDIPPEVDGWRLSPAGKLSGVRRWNIIDPLGDVRGTVYGSAEAAMRQMKPLVDTLNAVDRSHARRLAEDEAGDRMSGGKFE